MTRESSSRRRRWRSEHGTSAVEYALIVAGAGIALIGGVVVLSGGLKTAYEASAQGAEAGVTVDQEAAGSNDQAVVPERDSDAVAQRRPRADGESGPQRHPRADRDCDSQQDPGSVADDPTQGSHQGRSR